MVRSILVPIDQSENSSRAVLFATLLATKLDASVLLLHILENLPARKQLKDYLKALEASEDRHEGEIEDVINALSKSGEDKGMVILEKAASKMKKAGVESVATSLEDGDPAKVILECLDSGSYDIVVMGRRGLGGLKGLLIGSVSQKVSTLADCTVVTVK